jgi:hypothetical protein
VACKKGETYVPIIHLMEIIFNAFYQVDREEGASSLARLSFMDLYHPFEVVE